MNPLGQWATEQLTAFATSVSAASSRESALRRGVEGAAEALEAEVAAMVDGHSVVMSVGFSPGQVPEGALVLVGEGRASRLEIPGAGSCPATCASLEDGKSRKSLVLARSGSEGFAPEEAHLLRGFARVLALTLRTLVVLDEERELRKTTEREVHERVLAEQELREIQERTQLIVDTAHDAFVSMDADGLITAWNPAAERTFGWRRSEVVGRPIETVIPPRLRKAYRRGLERFLAPGEGKLPEGQLELVALHRGGHEFPVELTITALPTAESWVFHSFLRDITARRRVQRDLEQRAAQQASVAALGRKALEGIHLSQLMKETARGLAETLGVEYTAILELLPNGTELVPREGIGVRKDTRISAGAGSAAGYTIRSAAPVVVEDWRSESRFAGGPLAEQDGLASGMSTVIRGRERPFGVLLAQTRTARSFSSDDVNFLEATANVLADAIERKRVEEEIRHQALHDPLTGLPNRMLFLDRLRHANARSRRSRASVGVLFIDIDRFKAINDSLSHEAGDELLRALGPRLNEALRVEDTLARFGGDEFVVLCEEINDERDAVAVAERVVTAFARPFIIHGVEYPVTASVGVALATAGSRDPEELIRDADAAMYQAKQLGGGRYELCDERMRVRSLSRLHNEEELRLAIERHELRAYYQPIVSAERGEARGFEALLRWEHPTRGLLPPAEFIPLAERSGLISPIGRWMLEQSCRQTARWIADHPSWSNLRISVNLSPCQVAKPDFAEMVADVLDRTGVKPGNLALEITESVLIEDTESSLERLYALKALGVSLALDDFGTGYSSLKYRERFPIDELKVDRSFVAGLGNNASAAAIVTAVVSMAGALGITVVAEGVETADEESRGWTLGCQFAQGYRFARPLSAKDAEAWLFSNGRNRSTLPLVAHDR